MGADTKIEWCDHTFNPWEGCTKVSPGCANCYAEARNIRWFGGVNWGKGAPRRRTTPSNWNEPVRWNREAAKTGTRQRVFCASLADWLDDEVPIEWLADLLALIHATPHLDWLLLTKRPENWSDRLHEAFATSRGDGVDWVSLWLDGEAPANVWIGTSVEDQPRADQRIPELLKIPVRVRFLSCEPLLGPVDITRCAPFIIDGDAGNPGVVNSFNATSHHPLTCSVKPTMQGSEDGVHWVICGGESGPDARPMNPAWARSLRDQCAAAGVPFFFKQNGEFVSVSEVAGDGAHHLFEDGATVRRIGKKSAGRLLDGVAHSAFPA